MDIQDETSGSSSTASFDLHGRKIVHIENREGRPKVSKKAASQEFDYHQSITISRDDTKASQPEKRKLIVLQEGAKTSERTREHQDPTSSNPRTSAPSVSKAPELARRKTRAEKVFGAMSESSDQSSSEELDGPQTRYPTYDEKRGDDAGAPPAAQNNPGKGKRTAAQKRTLKPSETVNLGMNNIEEQINRLQRLRNSLRSTAIQVFHTIEGDSMTYLAEPSWTVSHGDGQIALIGHSPLVDTRAFLKRNPEVAFAVYKHYNKTRQSGEIKNAHAMGLVLPDPIPTSETIQLVSEQMKEAMHNFHCTNPLFEEEFPNWDPTTLLESPFLFWYRLRGSLRTSALSDRQRQQIQLLTEWIDSRYQKVYADAEDRFRRGNVSHSTMPFFVRPGDVLVATSPGEGLLGYIAESWAKPVPEPDSKSDDSKDKITQRWKPGCWELKAWSYKYNGHFYRTDQSLHIDLGPEDGDPDVEIRRLKLVPLRFAQPGVREQLVRRGQTVWACRHRRLIEYSSTLDGDLSGEVDRYMIDAGSYTELHPSSPVSVRGSVEMKASVVTSDKPPQEPELLVLPSTLIGYNLRQKKWKDLQVDQIRDVTWNKQAFEHLVIDTEVKDIIEALVTSKINGEQSTDLIQGKGNGLIVLLHGSPGTGKTFTAESVAELAEKPLYRVTCGDIGTKPDQVEKYLESVLHLGKIWGCVVLLDEADVFLEQRALTDLERNALVSVFLRVIEYYEGILILTSNRVSTFDEAFKSRILLPLHYKPLNLDQRRQIWDNFLQRLRTTEDATSSTHTMERTTRGSKRRRTADKELMDFEGIRKHLGDLAKIEMNGRQIRNVITTARQLARFKSERMNYGHLKHVIDVTQMFDDYLEKEHNVPNDSTMAWGKGLEDSNFGKTM